MSSSMRRPTWTLATPSKPSAGSARSTATPWGSRIPAFGRTRTRARIVIARARSPARPRRRSSNGAQSRCHAGEPGVERLAGDELVGVDVALARPGDDIVGDRRCRRLLVPAGAGRPVAHVLLVEARLRAPDLVRVGGPEARGVGRQH